MKLSVLFTDTRYGPRKQRLGPFTTVRLKLGVLWGDEMILAGSALGVWMLIPDTEPMYANVLIEPWIEEEE